MDNNSIYVIKQNICRRCLELNTDILKSILNFLKKEYVDNKLFNKCSDGIRINLDNLDNKIIIKLNDFIEYKLSDI